MIVLLHSKGEEVQLRSKDQKQIWVKILKTVLYKKDRQHILSGNSLEEIHINTFQLLVKTNYKHIGGLINTMQQYKLKLPPQNGTFNEVLQVVHVRDSQWAALQRIDDDKIRIYDSVYYSLDENTVNVIC